MDLDNGREQNQPENERDYAPESDLELEQGVVSDLELEPDQDAMAGLDLLALVTENKVCSFII
jgi:hypothetical protein